MSDLSDASGASASKRAVGPARSVGRGARAAERRAVHHALLVRNRRLAERRQVDHFQRAHALGASACGQLSIRDDRAERRRSRRSRRTSARFANLVNGQRIVPATVRFVDIAGLVRGASTGQGLGNAFLSHIRETDAIAMVVRCFEDANVTHVEGHPDPARDIEIVAIELALADLATMQKRIPKLEREARANPKLRARLGCGATR